MMIHMNFPPEHPIEEIGRVLLALLIKYLGLEPQVAKMVDDEIESPGGLGGDISFLSQVQL